MSPGHKKPGPRRFHGLSLARAPQTALTRSATTGRPSVPAFEPEDRVLGTARAPATVESVGSSLRNGWPFELPCPYRKIRILGLVPVEVNAAGDLVAGAASQPVSGSSSTVRLAPRDSGSLLGRDRVPAFGGAIPSFPARRRRRVWQRAAGDDS